MRDRDAHRRTGILVHGRHLQTRDWQGIVWGHPPEDRGELPTAVAVALEEHADLIVLGTGASTANGKLEAEFTRDFLLAHVDELQRFRGLQHQDMHEVKTFLSDRLRTETQSQNTVQEIRHAASIFAAANVERMILVSAPTHIVRCLRDAMAVLQEDAGWRTMSRNLSAVPSDVSYWGYSPADVEVLEPPHRPDSLQAAARRYRVLRATLQKVLQPNSVTFLDELEALLSRNPPTD